MGRGKIEIKRIENQNNRKVTFAKRRDGLLKKAREISVLCDAKVSVVIFGPNSRLYSNKPPPETFSSILDVYHKQSTQRLWDEKHEDLDREIERVKKENENMNIELRHYKAEDIQSLSPRELASLENLLENGLTCIRNKKAELVEHLRNRRDIAEAENVHLQNKLAEMNVQGNNIGDEYNQRIVNANSNIMPFSFRVQPMQPNLHGMGFRN